MTSADTMYMSEALELAERGLWTTTPNPRVGCIIVAGEKVVGRGWHERAGSAHAEINALKQAGDAARDATAYITLEPCNHQGRTPPCTASLISAGVGRVVFAATDPNPHVQGSGAAKLAAAGIEVLGGVLADEAQALNIGYEKRMRTGLPYVRCKLAMSLDGRTAMASGESKWITGVAAREDVQRLRARSCAVVTGIDTVLADDPSLNVRADELGVPGLESESIRQPLRVIVDSRLRVPENLKIFALPGKIVVATAQGSGDKSAQLSSATVEVKQFDDGSGAIDLKALLQDLADRDCNEILIESGPTLAASWLESGLVDELIVYVAPKLMGATARPLLDLSIESMSDAVELELISLERLGKDLRVCARPVEK